MDWTSSDSSKIRSRCPSLEGSCKESSHLTAQIANLPTGPAVCPAQVLSQLLSLGEAGGWLVAQRLSTSALGVGQLSISAQRWGGEGI